MTILSCLLTAVISALLFPPFNLAALVPAALVPMLWAMHREASMRRRILAGWLAGCVYWMVVCHWIGAVLDAYGGLSGPLSLLALVLFAAVKALHWAGFAWGAGLLIRRPWAIPGIAALWTGLERTQGPLGFAWLMLGNAGIEMALPLRLAPVFGVYGLSFLFAALATGLTLMALRRPRKELLWLAPFAGLALLPAVEVAQPAAQEAVSMQMNVAGDTRWTPEEKERAARQFSLLSLESALRPGLKTPALMLWPEVPAPFYYYDDPAFRQLVTETARLASTPLLFGTIAYTPERQPLNSAVLLGSRGELLGRYDKNFLVPFGEFVPAGFGWIEQISGEAGAYAAGRDIKVFPLRDAGGREHSVGTIICYESAFPHLVRRLPGHGAEAIVNLTNDGYFGRSSGPRNQHLWLARMRAVENRRWILRSANDGITASIDPAGGVHDRLPEFARQAGRLHFAWLRDMTFYTRHGDWFAWTCLALGGGLAVWQARRPA